LAYSALCHRQSTAFAAKWLTGNAPEESILSSPDTSSMADMGTNYVTVQGMRPFVFDQQFVLTFLIASALPTLPLVATVMPIQDLILQIVKALA
ncbi:MAG: hypothetical protein K2Z81_09100, partial [Cyanobacteria bacterium]|nr:hypothetical protein [Cyanobacteriota bacterium]